MNEYSHLTFSFRLKCIMHLILVFKNNHLVRVQWQSEVNSVNRDNLRAKSTSFTLLRIISFECYWFFTCCFFRNAPRNGIMKSKIPHTDNSSPQTAQSWQLPCSHTLSLFEHYILCTWSACLELSFKNVQAREKTWIPICLATHRMNILTPSQHQLLPLFGCKRKYSQGIQHLK